jgi:hypothetical protein
VPICEELSIDTPSPADCCGDGGVWAYSGTNRDKVVIENNVTMAVKPNTFNPPTAKLDDIDIMNIQNGRQPQNKIRLWFDYSLKIVK